MRENLTIQDSSPHCTDDYYVLHNNDLPISAQALGYVAFDGTSQNPQKRITQYGNFIIIDSTQCYAKIKTKLYPKNIWVRMPSFYPLLNKSSISELGLELIFQINDYRVSMGAFSAMNALYDPYKKEYLATSLLPYDSNLELSNEDEEKLISGEQAIIEPNYNVAYNILTPLLEKYPHHPRINYDLGVLHIRLGSYLNAKEYFHTASLWGHPDGFKGEIRSIALQSQKVRDNAPNLIKAIDEKDYQTALTFCDELISISKCDGYAIKAYLQRKIGRSEECIENAKKSLSECLTQSDVYTHLTASCIELQDDSSAEESAKLHLKLYPQNPQAYTDALDVALLRGKEKEARFYALGYLCHAVNYNTALHNLFKYYDIIRDWQSMAKFQKAILPFMQCKTPETLVEYTETLTEIEDYESANLEAQKVLANNPNYLPAVLAYGRTLARSGDCSSAINLLKTVLHDQSNKTISPPQYFLLISFLSELLRNNGEVNEALILWENIPVMNFDIVKIAGTRPLVEYAYCLASHHRNAEAIMISRTLSNIAPNDYIVQELHNRLVN